NDFIRGPCRSAGLRCKLVRHGVVLSMRFNKQSRRLVSRGSREAFTEHGNEVPMIDRRTFLKEAGSFASAALVLPPMQKPPRYKIGLQLFTVNRDMNRDPIASLDRVAQMGYEEVETYGIDPDALTYYRLPAAEFAKRLQDRNLPTPSGHYDLQKFLNASTDDLNRYVDRCAEGARPYIVCPYLEPGLRTLD